MRIIGRVDNWPEFVDMDGCRLREDVSRSCHLGQEPHSPLQRDLTEILLFPVPDPRSCFCLLRPVLAAVSGVLVEAPLADLVRQVPT